ncbi:glycoside hydrolase family 88 protein [Flammeovirga yaeyamensis]|uniref:Glycoside hydrolase family 88 protein n=1 Tax=Flammeovirga yaeyamensis TaxID=367791 RepID=A0AAX1ND48_9BACT|nr:glycoside hydrolase family 88 protein [Flammeovirga yaeyamensis]MBB3696637.1 rhamnogalacturonyl hydrolase YesR [Flammeovirga yaeyamensis]NMF33310.1 hypothetical protein [Flammeovirga yaeyamensis]QWG05412.1 glycoside hydrolase family 88 protein [Flammeovirga yaeyamensis]
MRLLGQKIETHSLFFTLLAGMGVLLLGTAPTLAQRLPKAVVKEQGVSSEAYQSISFNASYNWNTSSSTNAIFHQGKYNRTYMTWVDNYGDIHVGTYDYQTKEISSSTLFDNVENIPVESTSILVKKDGKLLVFASFKGEEKSIVAQSVTSENIKDWVIKDIAQNDVKNIQAVNLNDNQIALCWQNQNNDVYYSTVNAKGEELFNNKILVQSGVENYKVISNGSTSVHMVMSINNHKNESGNNLSYLKIEEGKVNTDQIEVVLQDQNGKGLWAWDIAISTEGNPVMVYSNEVEEKKYIYGRVQWNGKKWDNRLVSDVKGDFAYGEISVTLFQVGGISIDKTSTNELYLSVKRGEHFEIEKLNTTNQGKSWRVHQITSNSTKDNVLPLAVNGAGLQVPSHVVWLQNSNDYFGVNRLEDTNEWFLKRAYTALKIDELTPEITNPLAADQIKAVMHDVADWQMVTPRYNKGMLTATNWHYGAMYVGVRAMYEQFGGERYKDELVNIGQAYNWQLMNDIFHADRLAVVDNWAWLYSLDNDPYMIDKSQWALDIHLAQNYKKLTDVRFKKSAYKHHWWTWCDALFMAPPSFVQMWKVTGETKYLDYMNEQWWKTSDYLYSPEDSLFFRDDRFFEKRSDNGKKIFWSRGNGWVASALARILTDLPKDYPTRDKFVKQYKEMAAMLLKLQDEDGMWRVSLHDPEYLDLGETSGSAFFTYALAWGVNNGLVDKKYQPNVEKAWIALCNNVNRDGQLGYVQQVAGDPYPFKANESHVYAAGAFLLAGKEILSMENQTTKVPN